jgi:hypothetical protein
VAQFCNQSQAPIGICSSGTHNVKDPRFRFPFWAKVLGAHERPMLKVALKSNPIQWGHVRTLCSKSNSISIKIFFFLKKKNGCQFNLQKHKHQSLSVYIKAYASTVIHDATHDENLNVDTYYIQF